MSPPAGFLDEPWRFDLFATLRKLEQAEAARPRIGRNDALRDEVVRLGQNPYLAFPASTIEAAGLKPDGRLRIIARFLGQLGPQGPLPLATTAEALAWLEMRDESFARFLDLFNNRFIQLFYRAWADARPIAQHARLDDDRFASYVGSFIGLGRPMFLGLDSVPDERKLRFAGLAAPAAKSATRLRALLEGVLGLRVEIHEFVGSRLPIEPEDQAQLGSRNATLGVDAMVGAAAFSVSDKITVRVRAATLDEFESVLPESRRAEQIADLVLFYLGEAIEWDVEIALPEREARPMRLGQSGAIGWTSWLAPKTTPETEMRERIDARFDVAERVKARRAAHALNS